jgi:acyl-CoA reductase-like NAD-dependent aldehyde dehydrogenase
VQPAGSRSIALPSRGFYYPPTLLSNVHPTSIVAQQEIFGPVLAAMTFRTPAEAVELANNTVYGLGRLRLEREHQRRARTLPRKSKREWSG